MTLKLAENIKELRKLRGVTQGELAGSLKVTPQSVSRWETGQAYPDVVLLPQIAAFFDITLDELMLGAETTLAMRKKELHAELASLRQEDTLNARMHICDLYEMLCKDKPESFTHLYFRFIMETNQIYGNISESKLDELRSVLANQIRLSEGASKTNMLLSTIICEAEEKLEYWHRLFPYESWSSWEDFLIERYSNSGNSESWEKTKQQIHYNTALKLISCLCKEKPKKIRDDKKVFMPATEECYSTALKVLNCLSERIDDIFLPQRIKIEFGLARSMFWNGKNAQGFEKLETVRKCIELLWKALLEETTLTGSTPFTSKLEINITDNDALDTLVSIWGTEHGLEFENVREDRRIKEFFEYTDSLFPSHSVVTTGSEQAMSEQDKRDFEHMRETAYKAFESIKAVGYTQTVVLKSTKGKFYSHNFVNMSFNADEQKPLISMLKRHDDTEIEKVIAVWVDKSIDVPSYALREALLCLNPKNRHALVLLPGLRGAFTKTIEQVMH